MWRLRCLGESKVRPQPVWLGFEPTGKGLTVPTFNQVNHKSQCRMWPPVNDIVPTNTAPRRDHCTKVTVSVPLPEKNVGGGLCHGQFLPISGRLHLVHPKTPISGRLQHQKKWPENIGNTFRLFSRFFFCFFRVTSSTWQTSELTSC